MKKTMKALFCMTCLILSFVFLLTSCSSLNFRSGVEKEEGDVVYNVIDNGSLVITNEGTEIPEATAKAFRSSVSIYSMFEASSSSQIGGRFPGSSGNSNATEYASIGSGVIYKMDKLNGDAFIVTNYHVVYNSPNAGNGAAGGISEDIEIYLYGSEIEGKGIKATFVGGSAYYDVAVLYVNDSDLLRESDACALDVADSDAIFAGDTAIAVGNAKGYGISASFGIVSVESEYVTTTTLDGTDEQIMRFMRVDTAVNSGNSGGGIFDKEGNLIGIVDLKIVSEAVENIAYAIPSNVVTAVADNIIDNCYGTELKNVQRGIVGISVSITDSKAVYDEQTGMMSIVETVAVEKVSDSTLADGVLKEGDIFVSVSLNGKTKAVTRQHHIIDFSLDFRVGDTVSFNILRNGEEKTVSVKITEDCLMEY